MNRTLLLLLLVIMLVPLAGCFDGDDCGYYGPAMPEPAPCYDPAMQ